MTRLFTTNIIDFAMTRKTHRFDRVIPKGAPIRNIRTINDRFSSFESTAVVDKKTGTPIELYGSTERILNLVSEDCPVINCI